MRELPGITPEETEQLEALGGLGPGDLAARLEASDIPSDRLRGWVPYLEVPAPAGRAALLLRGRVERSAGRARAFAELGARGESWGGKLRRSEILAPRPRGGGARHDGWISLTPGAEVVVAAGTFLPGTAGPDPWDDPMRGDAVQVAAPDPVLGTRGAARGLSVRAGSLTAAAGRDAGGNRRFLLSWDGRGGGLFLGRAEGEGAGLGLRRRSGSAVLSVALHDPDEIGPLLRGVARRRGLALATVWALAPLRGPSVGRVDASVEGLAGRGRIRLSGSLSVGDGDAKRAFLLARFASRRAGPGATLIEVYARDERTRLDLGTGRQVGDAWLRIEARLEHAGRRDGAGLSLDVRRGGSSGAVRAAFLARNDVRAAWAMPGATELPGRWGVLLAWSGALSHGAASVRALLPLDLPAREGLREALLRVEIERRAVD